MITRLYVDNYKCLVNFDLQLRDLTVLLGANGMGKTAVLDAMFALRRLLSGQAKVTDSDVFPARTLTRWQSRDRQVFELEVTLDNDEFRYRLEVEHEIETRKARIALERLESRGNPLFEFIMGEVRRYRDDHSPGPRFAADWTESDLARVPPSRDNRRLTRFLEFVRKSVICALQPANFETESRAEEAVLARDASNFASWYRYLSLERQDKVSGFTQALRGVIDGFRDIRMERVGLDRRAMLVIFEHSDKRYELRLNEISDGQRALIALYSLVWLAAGQGYTLFLDEPDNYLALDEIQPWLMELEHVCGEEVPQAVICSHYPEIIDYLGVDRGLVLKRESSGVTTGQPANKLARQTGLKLSELIARGWDDGPASPGGDSL